MYCAWAKVETTDFHEKYKIMRNKEANSTITHILPATCQLPFRVQRLLYAPPVLPTLCIYVFCMNLTVNKDYFSKQPNWLVFLTEMRCVYHEL